LPAGGERKTLRGGARGWFSESREKKEGKISVLDYGGKNGIQGRRKKRKQGGRIPRRAPLPLPHGKERGGERRGEEWTISPTYEERGKTAKKTDDFIFICVHKQSDSYSILDFVRIIKGGWVRWLSIILISARGRGSMSRRIHTAARKRGDVTNVGGARGGAPPKGGYQNPRREGLAETILFWRV